MRSHSCKDVGGLHEGMRVQERMEGEWKPYINEKVQQQNVEEQGR